MSSDGGNSRKRELDDFWDIEMIVPKRRAEKPSQKRSVDTVEISVSSALESLSDENVFKSEQLSPGVIKKYVSTAQNVNPSFSKRDNKCSVLQFLDWEERLQ